jgi:hypothetical protein
VPVLSCIGSGTDSKSIASEFASKVKAIFDNQTAINGQGVEMAEKVQDVQNVEDVKNAKSFQDAKMLEMAKSFKMTKTSIPSKKLRCLKRVLVDRAG